ncbi:MAG: alpha/beta hydrolase, partial [Gemmatimonadota bacterium]|nr:alpha/beta hydrolase [Gemmatimonadota bacterium]
MLTVGAGLLALALPALAAGQVVWGSCPQDLGADGRCGWAQVPLDPARAAGPTLEIRVIVLPATGEAKEEPVLFFPGGPGQATTALIPMATQVFAAARETRDFVFIGQRGAGESAPLGCDIDVAGNPHWAFGHLWVVEEIRRCRAEVPAGRDPRLFTTREYVADIDAVLDDLEYGRVLLWGGSGGTRTATAYLREHPDRVVGAVLDGVVPIDYALPLRFAATLEEAWRRVVADCGAQPECAAAFPDLAGDL